MKNYTGREILALPMQPNDANAKTIGDYLVKLSEIMWNDGECADGKRPFGNSSWELEVIEALVLAEAIAGRIDTDGYVEDYDEADARVRVKSAYEALFAYVRS